MLASVIFWTGAAIIWFPPLTDIAVFIRDRSHRRYFDRATEALIQAAGSVLVVAANVLWRDWRWAIAFAVMALFDLWQWRRRRRKRRTLAALGAKARARIEAMKQAMRERAKPRPVLKPGLQGAR